MKLENRTQFKDEPLRKLIRAAAMGIGGLNLKDVIFRALPGRAHYFHGSAGGRTVRVWFAALDRFSCPAGAINSDLDYSFRTYEIIAHELKHIKDLIAGFKFGKYRRRWRNRPHERRAIRAAGMAMERAGRTKGIEDRVIAFAIDVERRQRVLGIKKGVCV